MKRILTLVFAGYSMFAFGQWIQYADTNTHSRGITASKGKIYLSSNTGLIYEYNISRNATACINMGQAMEELRDIDVNGKRLVSMQSTNSSKLVYKINNKVFNYEVDFKNYFFDGMALYAQKGMIMGDPVDDKFVIYFTTTGGMTWLPPKKAVPSRPGEYGFAASGTNVIYNDHIFYFVSGGTTSRFFSTKDMGESWFESTLPFDESESSGAYSIAMMNDLQGVVVGGNYKTPDAKFRNCFSTNDGGKTWTKPVTPPQGFRSCIVEHKGVYYCCGTNGLDYSTDGGMNWKSMARDNFLSLVVYKNKIYASSTKGRMARFSVMKK